MRETTIPAERSRRHVRVAAFHASRLASGMAVAACLAFGTGAAGAAEPACGTAPAELPPALAAWSRGAVPVAAVMSGSGQSAGELPVGRAATLRLAPGGTVSYKVRPHNAGGGATFGGMAAFTVDTAATYRVALDGRAWIDVIEDGAARESLGHQHGPACSSIAKMVDFKLAPGRHVLQISDSAVPQIRVLVLPAGPAR